MTDRFQACLAETLKWEGGYSNDAHDPGGPTMHGIIQREYDSYRAHKGQARRSVRQIAPEEEQEIYRASYWAAVRGDELPAGVDMVLFDEAVNSGPARALKDAQRALGLTIDGHLGASTLAALCACDATEFINTAMDTRFRFLKGLGTWRYFGKGWGDRCKGVRSAALQMAGARRPLGPTPLPIPEPDVQSATQGKTPRVDPAPISPTTAIAIGSAVAGPVAGALATPAAQVPTLPAPPDTALVTGWQAFATAIQEAVTFTAAHWPFVLGAVGIWGFLTYGLPALHRRFA